jgi:nucleoside-diphosphate-sugar epimerase
MALAVTVFGYGAVGRETVARLCGRGDTVRVAQRHRPKALPPTAAFAACDVLDEASARGACAGSEAIICCLGFPYDARVWEAAWPKAMRNLLAVCARMGARFVFADNLYMYGPQSRPLSEDMALTTFGRKPRVRASITRLWQEAHAQGRVAAAAVRASDFYGPHVATSVLSEYGVKRLLAGKAALLPYSPDHPHDFTYVPDFARALLTVLDAPVDAYGQAWHVPNAPIETLRELIGRAAHLIGTRARVQVLPRAVVRIAGLFNRQLFELIEMQFQTDRPYHVAAHKFATRFWADATSFDSGLSATIASYRTRP